MILVVVALVVIIVVAFIIALVSNPQPFPDWLIIRNTARDFGVSKQTISTDQIVTQLLGSTLAQSRDVPIGAYVNVIDVPSTYDIANIYTVSQINNVTSLAQTPVVLNEPFEIFLAAVNMAQTRSISFFYLFSLYSFGEQKLLAFSDQPIAGGYSSVSMYPWQPLQYATLLSNIGPAIKRGYFDSSNFVN